MEWHLYVSFLPFFTFIFFFFFLITDVDILPPKGFLGENEHWKFYSEIGKTTDVPYLNFHFNSRPISKI